MTFHHYVLSLAKIPFAGKVNVKKGLKCFCNNKGTSTYKNQIIRISI